MSLSWRRMCTWSKLSLGQLQNPPERPDASTSSTRWILLHPPQTAEKGAVCPSTLRSWLSPAQSIGISTCWPADTSVTTCEYPLSAPERAPFTLGDTRHAASPVPPPPQSGSTEFGREPAVSQDAATIRQLGILQPMSRARDRPIPWSDSDADAACSASAL